MTITESTFIFPVTLPQGCAVDWSSSFASQCCCS